jgi:hypothetical protein
MSNNTNAQATKSTSTPAVAPAAPVEQVKPITPTEAIQAIVAQFAPDARVTAYQITSIANVALDLLGSTVKLAPQPTYNMTKGLRMAAQAETGEQAIEISKAIPVIEKLIKKAQGGAVAQGERLDLNALKANAAAALKR